LLDFETSAALDRLICDGLDKIVTYWK